MLFKGYLPIGWSDAMEGLLSRQGLLIKDFGKFIEQQSERLKNHAEKLAETIGRPFEYINGKLRKDDYAKEIAKRDGITQGLIYVTCWREWSTIGSWIRPSKPMKMYDEFGCVLRIETVINNPREFKARRSAKRRGEFVRDCFPMGKGVANMPRYREVCMAANRRFLEALAVVPNPGRLKEQIQSIGRPARTETRSHRALNPASKDDVELLAAVMRGEHSPHGFCNANIREHLNEPKSASHMTTQNDARKMRSC